MGAKHDAVTTAMRAPSHQTRKPAYKAMAMAVYPTWQLARRLRDDGVSAIQMCHFAVTGNTTEYTDDQPGRFMQLQEVERGWVNVLSTVGRKSIALK